MTDKSRAIVYKLKDGVKIGEVDNTNIKEKCDIIGYQANSNNYIEEFDLSGGPYFIPKSVGSNKKYDYNYVNYTNDETIRIALVGGGASHGSGAGGGYFYSYWVRSNATARVGFFTITDLD